MSKLYRNFNDAVREYTDTANIHKREVRNELHAFAKWLDGFRVVDDKIEIAIVRKAWQVDRESLLALIDRLGVAEAQKVIAPIIARHRHLERWQNKLEESGVASSPTAQRFLKMSAGPLAWLTWRLKKLAPPRKAKESEANVSELQSTKTGPGTE